MRKVLYLILLSFVGFNSILAQNILPTPLSLKINNSEFIFKNTISIKFDNGCVKSANFLTQRLQKYITINNREAESGTIVLTLICDSLKFGAEGYFLKITEKDIVIKANTDAGIFYGIQSLLQLLPDNIQAGKDYKLTGTKISGLEIFDKPKYLWRSFMLDSGRQYQSPEFIKRYLSHMAMLKMNVFHWHLTEGQGWRIEIKKYPKLTQIGSHIAEGDEQQGFYSQEDIKQIVAYANQLNITVVPEIDVPGHSEAALTAYPEMTCFKKAPKTVMSFSANLFCGGRESTYVFLQDILDEVCEMFPSKYIHLGGDEAPKANWDQCPDCHKRIRDENLNNSHDLQLYFSSRLAKYLKSKGRKVIFWGDVVHNDGVELPDNVIVHWWNTRRHRDLALKNALQRGHQVICNTNYYTYLNFPVSPWSKYAKDRTFDIRATYENNPSDLKNPYDLVLGMGCCLWTDWHVKENMIDQRVFPRIYSLSEQMWSSGERLTFDEFYLKVKKKYPLLKLKGINYGPALIDEIPENYKWD